MQKPKEETGKFIREFTDLAVPEIYQDYPISEKIIARTEHPLEVKYSGLGESFVLNNGYFDEDHKNLQGKNFFSLERIVRKSGGTAKLKEHLKGLEKSKQLTKFLNLIGKTFEEYKEDLDFSFWKYIDGKQGIIVKDDSVADRYHILSGNTDGDYNIVTNNSLEVISGKEISNIDDKIRMYLEVDKALTKADRKGNTVGIIEFVESSDLYFLQWHELRKYEPVDFDIKSDGVKADWVRGKTSREGQNYRVSVFLGDKNIPEHLSTFADRQWLDNSTVEYFARDRPLQFTRPVELKNISPSHVNLSILYKPELTMMLDREKLIGYKELDSMADKFINKEIPYIDVNVTSNGREAYVKRV